MFLEHRKEESADQVLSFLNSFDMISRDLDFRGSFRLAILFRALTVRILNSRHKGLLSIFFLEDSTLLRCICSEPFARRP